MFSDMSNISTGPPKHSLLKIERCIILIISLNNGRYLIDTLRLILASMIPSP